VWHPKILNPLEKHNLQLRKLPAEAEPRKAVLTELAEVLVYAPAVTSSRQSRDATIRHH